MQIPVLSTCLARGNSLIIPPMSARIVIVDDEPNMGKILGKLLTLEGYTVTAFEDSRKALEAIRENPPDLVLSDIRMPNLTGNQLLKHLHDEAVPCQVIMMTAQGSIEGAIECVKLGAFDYITKPFDTNKLARLVAKALEGKKQPQAAEQRPRALYGAKAPSHGTTPTGDKSAKTLSRPMIGSSPAIEKVRRLIERVAPSESPVLIMGESGTGKELAARSIHDLSNRNNGNYVAINCASIPENLIESELFGHAKGAFTGAHQLKIGLIELSSGGTLFLDEIGELPLNLQSKLLRVLQEQELTRVGETATINVDLRVVSATNRDLALEVKEKTFREDLYYRLNVITLELPPLRHRTSDIPELAAFFLRRIAEKYRGEPMSFTPRALELLCRQPWDGNIRELENTVERAVVLTDAQEIDIDVLPLDESTGDSLSGEGLERLAKGARTMVEREKDFKNARDLFEKQYLLAVLTATDFNVSEAAKRANMSRRNFYDKMEKLNIDVSLLKET
ncbi:MAG: sigma-54-dependent transcriptional regulator [Sumerlaeia bacterium]